MVLEARGLDVTPGMIEHLRRPARQRCRRGARVIYAEEVHHVAYGSRWFHFLCGRDDADPTERFTRSCGTISMALKPPFNEEKRAEAGLAPDFYWPLAEANLPAESARIGDFSRKPQGSRHFCGKVPKLLLYPRLAPPSGDEEGRAWGHSVRVIVDGVTPDDQAGTA